MMNDREFSNRKETLHGEFYENALKYPERIALIYENEKVSYKMLRLYALRAANYMWQRGVRRNDIKSWEKAVLGNVREFESNSNDIFDIIMRELENDK